MIRIKVDGVTATVTEKEDLTAGRVGLACGFKFSAEWAGLFKTAVFQGIETVDVALVGDACIVPHESMAVEGVQLKIGVYGANGAGTIVIPTIWAKAGKIQPSANPSGVEPTEPTQNANAYAVLTAEQALEIAQSVRDDADNGVFDGEQGAKGADGSAIWNTSVEPTYANPAWGYFLDSDLSGPANRTPAVGDLIFTGVYYYPVISHGNVSGIGLLCRIGSAVSIKGAAGPQGPQGEPGPGISFATDAEVSTMLNSVFGSDLDGDNVQY